MTKVELLALLADLPPDAPIYVRSDWLSGALIECSAETHEGASDTLADGFLVIVETPATLPSRSEPLLDRG